MCVKDTNLTSFGSPCWRVKDPTTGTTSAVCTDMSLRLCQATHRLCRPTVPKPGEWIGTTRNTRKRMWHLSAQATDWARLGSMVATSQRWYAAGEIPLHCVCAIIQWDSNDALGFPLLVPCNPERMTNRCVHEASTRCCLDPWFQWVLCTRQTHLPRRNIRCRVPTFRTRLQLARTPNHYICFCSREAFAPSSNNVRVSVGFVHPTLVAFLCDEWKKATLVSKKLDDLSCR